MMSNGDFGWSDIEPKNFPNYIYTDGKAVHFDLLLHSSNYTSDVIMDVSTSYLHGKPSSQCSSGCIQSEVYTLVNGSLVYSETTYTNISISTMTDTSMLTITGVTLDKSKYYHVRGVIPCELQYHKVILNLKNAPDNTYTIMARYDAERYSIYSSYAAVYNTSNNQAILYIPIFEIDISISVQNNNSHTSTTYTEKFTYNKDESQRVTTIDVDI